MKNGHRKGGVAEREVAKLFEEWWRTVEPEAEFFRTPGSGGFYGRGRKGVAVRTDLHISGDIATTAKRFPFCIEVKRRDFTIQLSEGPGSLQIVKAGVAVFDWWQQAQRQARESGLIPMMWMRGNREPWKVVLPLNYSIPQPFGDYLDLATPTTQLLRNSQYGELIPTICSGKALLELPAKVFAL